MRNRISKTLVGGVAALSLAAAVVATTEPASAQTWHGGGGGWHGGGWRGGGVWHGGGWRGGHWYGGWWGPAVVAGLAAGAIATAPYWGGYGYGYGGGGCWQVRPIYDPAGNYIGQQPVNVCGGY
jgi:hypothetical protein